MSSKTRTRKTRTTVMTGAARALRSVPDQLTIATVRTDTEDKLWAALHANPDSSAADLSAAAKIGKSTAQKILVKWAGDGSVTRTPGIAEGGRRVADLWAIAETDPSDASDTVDDGTVTGTDGALADERTVEDTAPADTTQDEPTTTPGDPDPADIADDAPAEDNLAESVDAESTAAPAADDAQDTTDATDDAAPEKAEPAEAEPTSTEATNPAHDATPDNATQSASDDGKGGKAERLAPGALRGMVEDHLRDHPAEQFGPTAIAKAVGGKSSGAVSNALDKLVEDGVAVKTQDKPRRFGLASAERTAAAAPTH